MRPGRHQLILLLALIVGGALVFNLQRRRSGTGEAREEVRSVTQEEKRTMVRNPVSSPQEIQDVKGDAKVAALRAEVQRLNSQLEEVKAGVRAGETNQEPETLEEILQMLWEEGVDSSVKYKAAEKLGLMEKAAQEGVPNFVQLLYSGAQGTAYAGAAALAFSSKHSEEAFVQLANGLNDPGSRVRDAALYGVGLAFNQRLENVNVDLVLPRVLEMLRDTDRTVRADAANTVSQYIRARRMSFEEVDPRVIPALTEQLGDPHTYARINAAWALAQMGEAGKGVVPEISRLLNDPEQHVREAAERALQTLQSGN